jgi:aminoglycoside phosphotransferase family enzyme
MNKEQIHQLLKEGTFQGKPLAGELIETHISWVILTAGYAFKLKKPMHYPFLDFSTLERRKHYCEREVLLNRRLTDIYLDVLPVRLAAGKYHLGPGEGETIGYAVWMKKMNDALKMDNLLRSQSVRPDQIIGLALKIAAFHQSAEVIDRPFDLEAYRELFNDLQSVHAFVQKNMGAGPASKIDNAVSHSDRFLETHVAYLSQRVEAGLQRDVHGDLHAKNIFLYEDPVIFDCIEFSDGLRQIDVLNEIAFFCMDLEAFGQHELSELFYRSYLEQFPELKDEKCRELFTYYKSYRANIRAKVNVLRAMQATQKQEREIFLMAVKKYLDLMSAYIYA